MDQGEENVMSSASSRLSSLSLSHAHVHTQAWKTHARTHRHAHENRTCSIKIKDCLKTRSTAGLFGQLLQTRTRWSKPITSHHWTNRERTRAASILQISKPTGASADFTLFDVSVKEWWHSILLGHIFCFFPSPCVFLKESTVSGELMIHAL